MRVHYVPEQEEPELHRIVTELSRNAGSAKVQKDTLKQTEVKVPPPKGLHRSKL